jgi:formylglycine-generating enzyme required for sulfatase activity
MVIIPKKIKKRIIIGLFVLFINTIFSTTILAAESKFVNSLGMEFSLIPAGSFVMGSPPDEPYRNESEVQHKVIISKPFYMQTTEVTIKQWFMLMEKRMLVSRNLAENMPITRVSWFDCVKFIGLLNKLGEGRYRLPTEAEWEYAARAGTTTAYSWGSTIDCDNAMYGNNSRKDDTCQLYIKSLKLPVDQPAPVKTYRPNAWGLYDMHGNVWEWCMDWYGDYEKTTVTDPEGPASGTMRVRRGGSWFKFGYSCRSANRAFGHPATRYQTTGFRMVRVAQ